VSSSANPPSPAESLTVAGRTFSAEELQLVRQLLANHPHLSRHELAATVCELLEWTRPNGRLKTRECRDLLERLTSREALSLPEKRPGRPSGPSTPLGGADPPLRAPLTGRLGYIPPVELAMADTLARRQQCREHLEKYH